MYPVKSLDARVVKGEVLRSSVVIRMGSNPIPSTRGSVAQLVVAFGC